MATLDWSQCEAVESIPGKRSRAWVFRGTRMPFSAVFENLQDMNVDELVDEFGVTREQVTPFCNSSRKVLSQPLSRARCPFYSTTERHAYSLAIWSAIMRLPRPAHEHGKSWEWRTPEPGGGSRVRRFVTTDKNLSYQQNLTGRKIAIVVLGQDRWTLIKPYVAQVASTVNAATPGSFAEVKMPLE